MFKNKNRFGTLQRLKYDELRGLIFRIYIVQVLVMFLHSGDPRILVRVVASQTFPGILSWGAWISIPVFSCQIVVLLNFFHVIDYNSKKRTESGMNGIKAAVHVGYGGLYVLK